ncbi:MAG: M3 family peptidase [Opitutaceae bacterium]|nr:M3 family peptidase [Opitutaceae bacterium]
MQFDIGRAPLVFRDVSTNAFLDPSFHLRWSELTPDRVAPAIEAALVRAQANIDLIATRDTATLNYSNTFLALENATEELTLAWAKVTHLQSVADSPALREAHNAMLPKVSAFYAGIPLNAALWARLRTFSATPAAHALSGIHRRFLDETVADFRQAGANLPAAERARLEALQTELAQLTQKYSENVLDATNAWQLRVEDEARLAGLPAHAKAAARVSAAGKNLTGWRFTLHQPSLEPFMTYLEDGALRREMWTASAAVGAQAPHDNTALIGRILTLRAEKAALLGKAHFADLTLERRMAKSGARALAFIEDMQSRAAVAFARECRELEEFKAKQTGGAVGPLAPWELGFWAERLRKECYDFDEEILRPYFPMDRVIAGLFELAARVFGLRVTERATETWHAGVKHYDLCDRAGRQLGSFYADWHPREAKRGGAWMNYLITGGPRADGTRAPHLGLICGNMTPPAPSTGSGLAATKPALLTHREVETIFHEFGHLLHHLLGEVEIKSLNGVNVAWDFVELPSQIMENWTWERASLDLFARHHETGAAIPEEIFAKMTAAKNFRSACVTMRQVALAKMDLLLHTRTAEFAGEADVETKARAAVANCLVPTVPPGPTVVKRFTHVFSDPVGYAAGYYSYKWAEVLDADAFTRFKREGLFNATVGAEFVEKVLSKGNSADPMELFRAFMGRDPDLNALLVRAGLV